MDLVDSVVIYIFIYMLHIAYVRKIRPFTFIL